MGTHEVDEERVKLILSEKGREYTLVRRLGKGGFATVFHVKDKEKQDLACKVIDRARVSEKLDIIKEPEVSSGFAHPYVIRVFHAFKTRTYLFTFMELCSGGSLDGKLEQAMRSKNLDLNQSITWFCQVASGVCYIHSKSYAHRDIKPDNIFITAENVPKLADFGFVTRTEKDGSRHLSTSTCGTSEYISPEIMTREPRYDAARADVYALGITFYQMLTLTVPFSGSEQQVMAAKMKAVIDWKGFQMLHGKAAHRSLQELVSKMLNPNPNQRMTSAEVIKFIAQHLIRIF